jgi:hypothetical protein
MSNIVDTIVVFRILRKLTTPFTKTDAFKTGVIDKDGKVLIQAKDRNSQQNKAFTYLDRLVFNLKKTLGKVPGGKSQIASYAAALALLKEHVEVEKNDETAVHLIERLKQQDLMPASQYDLSTKEGFLLAWEDAVDEAMTAGGGFNPSTTNADANASGLAGPTGPNPLGKKKKKKDLSKILNRRIV